MPDFTRRQTIRAARAETFNKMRERGVNLDDMPKDKPIASTLATAQALINDGVQRPTRHSIRTDNPIIGTFDGVNKTFTLTERAQSVLNTVVLFLHTDSGQVEVLTHSDAGAPSAGSCRITLPQTIELGEAPASTDVVLAVYLTEN